MFLKNLRTVLANPKLGLEFAAYTASRMTRDGHAMRSVYGDVKITGFSGFSEYHYCSEVITPAEFRYLGGISLPPGAIVDVGANLGVISIILAKRFPERELHSFEPNPSTFEALKENIRINDCKGAHAHGVAVADRLGSVQFEANPTYRGTTSISSTPSEHTISVPSVTLDGFAVDNQLEQIAFLKIDVEGYERLVVSGAEALLRSQRVATVFFEVCPAHAVRAGFAPEDAAAFLEDCGYSLSRFADSGALESAQSSQIHGIDSQNWIAVRA